MNHYQHEGTYVSPGQRELKMTLNRMNALRVLYSSLCFSVLIPVCIIAESLIGYYGAESSKVITTCIVCEVFQIVNTFVWYMLLSREEMDRYVSGYRLYYFVTLAFMAILFYFDCQKSNSIILLAISAIYMTFVPVFDKQERYVFYTEMTIFALISVVSADNGTRAICEALFICILTAVVASYEYDQISYTEGMHKKLRAKTISAEQDPLTGLTNRRGLARKANVLWPYCARSSTNVGVIAIDIDFFKKYNDKFGHPAGDRCLKQVADALKKTVKRESDICARTGGEEFLIFVQDMNENDMISLALRIRKNIEELKIVHAYAGVSKYVTVSMGIAIDVPDESNTYQELYEEADQSLYEAKTNGRNCIVMKNRIYGRMKNGLATVISI